MNIWGRGLNPGADDLEALSFETEMKTYFKMLNEEIKYFKMKW